MKAYCDTSFLFSLYVPDANSAQAAATLNKTRASLLISTLTEVELVNAISLRRFRGELTGREVTAAQRAFQSDMAGGVYSSEPVSAAVFERAKQLSRKHTASVGARSLDILHLACALVLGAEVLCTFDHMQSRLAAAEGLLVAPAVRRS